MMCFAPSGLNLCNKFNMKNYQHIVEYYKELFEIGDPGGINLDLLLIILP